MKSAHHDTPARQLVAAGNEATFYLVAGDGILYGLTRLQLEKLHELASGFVAEADDTAPLEHPDTSGFEFRITKEVSRYEDQPGDEVAYNIYTAAGELVGLTYPEVRCVSDRLSAFLACHGDAPVLPREVSPVAAAEPFPLEIREDVARSIRTPTFRAEVGINKSIYWDHEERHPAVGYTLYANEKATGMLTPGQFRELYRQLTDRLSSREHMAD